MEFDLWESDEERKKNCRWMAERIHKPRKSPNVSFLSLVELICRPPHFTLFSCCFAFFFWLWKDADQQNPINLLESWTLKRRMYVQHKTQYLLSSFHHQIHHINKIKSTCREKGDKRASESVKGLKYVFKRIFHPVCFVFHEVWYESEYDMDMCEMWFMWKWEVIKTDGILILTTIIVITQYTTDANCTN